MSVRHTSRVSRRELTSTRSGQFSGKSDLATRDMDSATWARMALSEEFEREIMAGTRASRRAALSGSGMGGSSWGEKERWGVRSRRIGAYQTRTDIFPSGLDEVFEVDTRGEADGALLGGLEDEGEKVGEEAGLDRDGLEGLLCLLPAGGVEGGEEERG